MLPENPAISTPISNPYRDLSARGLVKTIFRAESPEQFVRTFPAQSLYLALKHHGLHSSADLVGIASLEQCRLMLDFDLWRRDEFNEEHLWEWLSLTDDDSGLELLQKLLKCIDLKIIALIIARYVDVQIKEEKTDQPPAPGYYTPDLGATWIGINEADADKHFLIGRLLALLFETSAELFYQLLAVSATQTAATLEEEAFVERTKRLVSEGVPDAELVASLHAPLAEVEVQSLLGSVGTSTAISDIRAVEPFIYTSSSLEPLDGALKPHIHDEAVQAEITLLVNAAIIRFGVDFSSHSEVEQVVEQVRGIMNVGLERALKLSDRRATELYPVLGAKTLYRLGLTHLLHVRKKALKLKEHGMDENQLLALRGAKELPPKVPVALTSEGQIAIIEGKMIQELRPIERESDMNALVKILKI